MAVSIGAQGTVASWAGTANGQIVTGLGEHTATIDMTSGPLDNTPYTSSLKAMTTNPTLRSWGGTISGRLLTAGVANVGYTGSLSVSDATDTYVTHVRSWQATLSAIELDITEYGSPASSGWRSFRAGLIKVAGTYEALVDDTTVLENVYGPGTTKPTLTLTMNTGNFLSFACVVHQLGLAIPVGDLNLVTYGFESSGDITAECDVAGTGNIFADGVLAIPAAGSLVLATVAGSRTYTGDALWTSIDINHNPASYIDIDVNFRGTGALTIA